ncbi:MAG TPA: CvpA family protein, partial [Chloroflexia bacterium]|nr:CvpA family protein [Chloroflexia bacterium]
MQELLNAIPFLDVIIGLLMLGGLFIGWSQGIPRLVMITGALYTGFLLASVYYHLFSVTVAGIFHIQNGFVADLVSFVVLEVFISILMIALLLSLFGHIEIRGKMAIFDKIGGSILGLVTAVFVIGILVTLMRIPFEANKQKMNSTAQMPIVQVFNANFEKSTLGPVFMRTMPILMYSVVPMLPADTRERGAVPLLQSIVS